MNAPSPRNAVSFAPGNYQYAPGVFQYSCGVVADPGYAIRRVRLLRALPLAAGFELIERHLAEQGRPTTAFCACELRSPAPFDDAGFIAFNRVYVSTLDRWGIAAGERNPVARSNVCPQYAPPAEVSLYAFSYTVAAADSQAPSFVVSGSAEAPEGHGGYAGHVIRPGDTSPDGLREKARWVLGEMRRRLNCLGMDWADIASTHVYSVHDIHPLLRSEFLPRGAAPGGITWHAVRPPVDLLDFEMDVRRVAQEWVL